MNTKISQKEPLINVVILRIIAGYTIGFLLLLMLLSVFFVIPKINTLFEEQYVEDIRIELQKEVGLFENFIENQKTIIEDLAQFPSVTNSVMLSDKNNHVVNNLLENVVIGGEKGKLVLQDIGANVLVKTSNNLQGHYTVDEQWLKQILTGSIPYYFELLGQEGEFIFFKISVPIIYNGYVEGVLSGEIKTALNDIFVNQLLSSNIAISLTQNRLTVGSDSTLIKLARESSFELKELGILLTYITDDYPNVKRKRATKNLIFSVLLGSLAVSFILFVLLNYTGVLQRVKLNKAKQNNFKVYAMPIFVGVIGLSASITACIMVLTVQQTSIENSQVYDSKKQVHTIEEKLKTYFDIIDAIESFYNSSEFIDRKEFQTFVTPFLNKNKSIQALEWVPYTSHTKRNNYKEQAQIGGMKNYTIMEANNQGEHVIASERDYYFPVYYVEPLVGNEEVLGFDLASNKKWLATLIKTKERGNKDVTSKITLIQKDQKQTSIRIINPIFDSSLINESVKERNLLGFTVLVLKVDDFINEILQKENNKLSLLIQDISTPDYPEVLFNNVKNIESFSLDETINVAGRSWRINAYSNDIEDDIYWAAWVTLIGGLILSGLIVFGLIDLIRRREYIEQLVIIRTAELSASEEQHRAVVENAVDGLLTIDELGTIEKFNNAAEIIFGYSAQEVIGTNIKILMPAPYHEEHDGYLKNYRDTNVKKIIGIGRYVEGRNKDGTIFPIDLSVSEMKLGSTRKFSGIVRDISERVAFEKEREQFIEQLTDSNEELERFAFVCSHDLQEPLRMISSFSEKLQDHIGEDLNNDEKGKKYFGFVIDGAIRAQALIADILTYSSIGNDTKQLENVNVEDLIHTIQSNIFDVSDEKVGKITCELLPNLQGNKTQLYQLFQNLINNGLKYQKIDTEPHVHISVKDTDEHWTFMVQDNGIGMEERHLKKIFEVFQRLHRRSKYAGTGIGLSICKKVVERHGGTIWVESEKDVGSTFYFTLLKPKFIKDML